MRRVALALGAAFVLALAGCGGDDTEEPAEQGGERLRELGELTLWEGAQEVVFSALPSTAATPAS